MWICLDLMVLNQMTEFQTVKCNDREAGQYDCQYLGGAVHVIGVVLFTGGQCDMSDRLHWVGQGEQHLALLATGKATKPVGKKIQRRKNLLCFEWFRTVWAEIK